MEAYNRQEGEAPVESVVSEDASDEEKSNVIIWRALTVLFLVTTILCLVFAISTGQELRDISETNYRISRELDECRGLLKEVKDEQPLVITKVEMVNKSKEEIITPAGSKIYSSSTMYLAPQITYVGLLKRDVSFYIKFYRPSGTMIANSNSPIGYTYSDERSIQLGRHDQLLWGWGSENKGNWSAGEYRIEIWVEDKCLYSHTFTVY